MKDKVISFLAYSGISLVWFDICLLATRITLPSLIGWIMRIYYIIAIVVYLYDSARTNLKNYRKAAHAQYIFRKQQIKESFEAEYEAFRKEIHS